MSKFKVGDKVRILDGSKIERYTGAWSKEFMGRHVGKVHEIKAVHEHWGGSPYAAYTLDVDGHCAACKWDERGLELVAEQQKSQKIVITTDGKITTAALYDGKQKVREASAKCAPSDAFDFGLGASLALDRLMRNSETKSQIDRFFAGEIALEIPTNKTMDFLKECERHDLRWATGEKPTKLNADKKYFVCENNHLFYSIIGRDNFDLIWEIWDGKTSKKKNITKNPKDVYEALKILLAIKDNFDD